MRRYQPKQRCHGDHQQDAGAVDRELRRQAVAPFGHREVSEHRQQDAEAEDLQRCWPQRMKGQAKAVAQQPAFGRDEMHDDDRRARKWTRRVGARLLLLIGQSSLSSRRGMNRRRRGWSSSWR